MPLFSPYSTLCVARNLPHTVVVVCDPVRSLIRRVLIKGKGSSRKRLSLTRSYRYGRGLWYRTARTRLDSSNLPQRWLERRERGRLCRCVVRKIHDALILHASHVYVVARALKVAAARRGNTGGETIFFEMASEVEVSTGRFHRQFCKFKLGIGIM